jgi:hypothetical protein
MKNIFIASFLFVLAESLSAQEVISSAGETQSISGCEVNWTLGEPAIETISSGSIIFTQGFHQSKLTVTAIDELLVSDLELKVYPNPTTEFVVIQINQLNNKPAFSLYDLSGKLLQSQLISASETHVNLSEYASGTYLLKLNQNLQRPFQAFKIVKH